MLGRGRGFVYLGILILLALPLGLNLLKFENLCLNGYDIGIYHQAIVEMKIPGNMNPFLSVRGIPAFNDHFNPVLVPLSAVVKVFGDIANLFAGHSENIFNPFGPARFRRVQ